MNEFMIELKKNKERNEKNECITILCLVNSKRRKPLSRTFSLKLNQILFTKCLILSSNELITLLDKKRRV